MLIRPNVIAMSRGAQPPARVGSIACWRLHISGLPSTASRVRAPRLLAAVVLCRPYGSRTRRASTVHPNTTRGRSRSRILSHHSTSPRFTSAIPRSGILGSAVSWISRWHCHVDTLCWPGAGRSRVGFSGCSWRSDKGGSWRSSCRLRPLVVAHLPGNRRIVDQYCGANSTYRCDCLFAERASAMARRTGQRFHAADV